MKRYLFYIILILNLIFSLILSSNILANQDNGCGGVSCTGMGCSGGTVNCADISCPGGARVTCYTKVSN